MPYAKNDILSELDSNGEPDNPYKFFPTLDDGSLTISDNKIHLFADKNRWAIVFEKTGCNNAGPSIQKTLSYFGNCLQNQGRAGLNGRFISNTKFFILCPDYDIQKILEDYGDISKTAKIIKIRNIELAIEQDINVYKANHMPWRKYDTSKKTIDLPSLTRLLNFKYPEVFNATEIELRSCLPADLPKLMTIDAWFHVDCCRTAYNPDVALPSSVEAFQLIAEVLAAQDTTRYKPTFAPNSNWRNWKSGEL